MPLLSIIIPVYNSEKFLARSIDSILEQTYSNWELILVNDGSTDKSLEICRQYAGRDSRIQVINKENEGAGPARNAGMEQASGKYLAFPDSDDRMEPHAYEVCIDLMERENVDLLVFGMRTEVYDNLRNQVTEIVEDAIPEVIYRTRRDFRSHWSDLYGVMDLGSPCNKIYKKAIIDDHHIQYPNLRRMQDGVFNMYYSDHVDSFMSVNRNFFIRTWHSKEFQRKKMPRDFIACAIAHHQTLEDLLIKWGMWQPATELYFDERFSETILTAEFDYLPSQTPTLRQIYNHIRAINENPYIHNFYQKFSREKHIRKREYAMCHQWNFLLALDTYRRLFKK